MASSLSNLAGNTDSEKTHSSIKTIRVSKTTGCKRSPVMQYIKVEKTDDGRQIQTCKACGRQRTSMTIQSSRWAEHLVINCPLVP